MVDHESERLMVFIEDSKEHLVCYRGETLLAAMVRLGRKGIPVGCRSGGCGICKIRITQGSARFGQMSRAHVSPMDEAAGIVLACRCYPQSDIGVRLAAPLKKVIANADRPDR